MTKVLPLTVGPIVGHADSNHVRLWGRGEYETSVSGKLMRLFGVARIRKKTADNYDLPRFFKMSPNFDMSGVAIFDGLEENTQYLFQIGCFQSSKELYEFDKNTLLDWNFAEKGEFSTASSDPDMPRTFILGSCRYLLRLFGGAWFDDRGDKTFRSILRQIEAGEELNKLLMVGDQIYADDLNFLAPDRQVDQFLARYREAFSQPYIKSLMSKVSTYMTLDDHEIEDNWPSYANNKDLLTKFPAAMYAYQIYQASHSPLFALDSNARLTGSSDSFYYQFSDGCCDFFVMDTRTERDLVAGNLNDGEIIGEEQMQELLQWLADGSGKVKLAVTSVPFFPDRRKAKNDQWSGFRNQRDQIIAHIKKHKTRKVIFLSGDIHCSMAAELNINTPGKKTHKIYSIISSSFYWPYTHDKRKDLVLKGHLASAEKDKAYRLGNISDVFSGDNFSKIKISPSGFNVTVYERKGELKHTIEYQF
jgi:alkaline phosphatase D